MEMGALKKKTIFLLLSSEGVKPPEMSYYSILSLSFLAAAACWEGSAAPIKR